MKYVTLERLAEAMSVRNELLSPRTESPGKMLGELRQANKGGAAKRGKEKEDLGNLSHQRIDNFHFLSECPALGI